VAGVSIDFCLLYWPWFEHFQARFIVLSAPPNHFTMNHVYPCIYSHALSISIDKDKQNIIFLYILIVNIFSSLCVITQTPNRIVEENFDLFVFIQYMLSLLNLHTHIHTRARAHRTYNLIFRCVTPLCYKQLGRGWGTSETFT